MRFSRVKKKLKKWNRVLCHGMTCKTNARRDAIVIVIAISVLVFLVSYGWPDSQKNNQENVAYESSVAEEKLIDEEALATDEKKNLTAVISSVDTSTWIPYRNTWYGLTLRYPSDWEFPKTQKPSAGTLWEQRIEFRIKQPQEENPFEGFDVVIYAVSKIKEATNTQEYPTLKDAELVNNPECATIHGHLLEMEEFPAEEIYIPANDPCYTPTLYFSNTRDAYIYNVVPKIKENRVLSGDPADEIARYMPEYFAVASTVGFIDIIRQKKVVSKPKISAPLPYIYKKDSLGRRVCATKNDKPAKSNKNKGKHLDMECCLDPDEYPNPNCYYPPSKYGKYL